ncbi:MAG TPA: hypothetical protein VNR40_20545 [Steroidobacter sp.]|nr:hypothetical protein [Steroidobacter sp.]
MIRSGWIGVSLVLLAQAVAASDFGQVRKTTMYRSIRRQDLNAATLYAQRLADGPGRCHSAATTTFEPVPKAQLDAAAFHFAPPR